MTKRMWQFVVPALFCAGAGAWSSAAAALDITQTWLVDGMRNGADVREVRDKVNNMLGVLDVEMTQASIQVKFDHRVSEAEIAAAVAWTGEYRLTRKED